MMKKIGLLLLSIIITGIAFAQQPTIRPEQITIARDSFGVPHIFAPTDPEVAYGLAWAHAEDDFGTIQQLLLTAKARLGSVMGKKGAQVDYVVQLLNARATVDAQFNQIDPKFLQLIQGYLAGLQAYADAHPKEVIHKKLFPVTPQEYISATVFSIAVFCGVDKELPKILNGQVSTLAGFSGEGSNAFAIHPKKSTSGEAMLVINAHQPIEGATAFYEAHVNSDEGWNMLGGLFPGGCLIFHGTNEHLGWAHTVNYQDKIDVYQLKTKAGDDSRYEVDGEWLPLKARTIQLKVKGIPIKIKKTVYESVYGPTVKTKQGFFSLRLPALMDPFALQQWYAMNRATNFSSFYKALEQNHLAMFNIVYADRYDTIFYISNGKMPVRNPDPRYNWRSTLPGNTRATLWTQFQPLQQLPQQLNPGSGYLYNTNHSPFLATANGFQLNAAQYPVADGYERYHNNRSKRVEELMSTEKTIDYPTLQRIKFDKQFPAQFQYPYGYRSDSLYLLNAAAYPALQPLIERLQQWDRKADSNSAGAAIYLLAYQEIIALMRQQPNRLLTKVEAVQVFTNINEYLKKHFGKIDVVLGDVQRLVRGKLDWPQWGLPDVLAAVGTEAFTNGRRRMNTGDAYIAFVRYPKEGLPIIESVNTFGASSRSNHPHFSDQRPLYQRQQLKRMSLDKAVVLQTAEKTYHPQ